MQPKNVNCSVLLPTYNRPEMVEQCILSIAKQLTPPKELIILDQGHLDKKIINKKWKTLRAPTKLVYVLVSTKGKSNALNEGVKIAKSDTIAVIDDDCYAHPEWIQSLMKSIDKKDKTIITGPVLAGALEHGAVRTRDIVTKTIPIIHQKGKLIISIFVLSGCNFCFKIKDFFRIGAFNPAFGPGARFKSGDDVEWAYRVLSRGFKIYYEPDAIVYHRSWRSKSQDTKQMENYGLAAGAFIRLIYPNDTLNSLYHGLNITRWLSWEITKSLLLLRNPRPYIKYLLRFVRGFFDKSFKT